MLVANTSDSNIAKSLAVSFRETIAVIKKKYPALMPRAKIMPVTFASNPNFLKSGADGLDRSGEVV